MLYKSVLLNNHEDYIELLKELKDYISYIEILMNDERDTQMIDKFQNNIISIKNVNSWWGLNNKEYCLFKLYRLKINEELFKYLEQFETFGYIESPGIDDNNYSNFGKNDIAFLDNNENILLRTDLKNGFIDILHRGGKSSKIINI